MEWHVAAMYIDIVPNRGLPPAVLSRPTPLQEKAFELLGGPTR